LDSGRDAKEMWNPGGFKPEIGKKLNIFDSFSF